MTLPVAPFALTSISDGLWPALEILDIGAMPEGAAPRYQRLVDPGNATVSCFEPQAAQRARLGAAAHLRVFPDVLGDGRPGTLHVTRYPGCTSLFAPDPAVIDLFAAMSTQAPDGNFHVLRTEAVTTTRLDEIEACPSADYVKIDVQGAELIVLQNGTQKIAQAVVIECEVEFVPLYRGQPLFGEVQQFLSSQGMLFHKFLDIAGRTFRPVQLANPAAAISQGLWADAVFVRDFSDLGRYGDEQLLKAAMVLHEVYFSYDLVMFLLAEHDRRCGGDLADRYRGAMKTLPGIAPAYMTLKKTF